MYPQAHEQATPALASGGPQQHPRPQGRGSPARYLPVPGSGGAEGLAALETYWNDRLTYPTGRFDPAWVRVEVIRIVTD